MCRASVCFASLIFALSALGLPQSALAKSKKTIVTYSEVFSLSDAAYGTFACGRLNGAFVPGKQKKKKFTPASDELPKLYSALKKAEKKGKQKKIVKAQGKLDAALAKIAAQTALCNPQPPSPPNPPQPPTPPPAVDDALSLEAYAGPFSREDARYLLEKAGFGAALADESLLALGATQGVSALVDEFMRQKPEDAAVVTRVTNRVSDFASSTPTSKRTRQALMDLWVHTANPYSEKLALFLLSIWTISGDLTFQGVQCSPFWNYYSQLRLAAQGVTDIPALSVTLTREPMMLRFLDNDENVRGNPNENFARELMELFTLGPRDLDGNANYTETQLDGSGDIAAAAKMLTGWRLVYNSDNTISSRFDQSRHQPGTKTMFTGTSYQFSGDNDQDLIFGIFAHHPNAKIYYAAEILKDYVTPNPPRELIEAFAAVIAANGFQLRPSMATLLKSKAFYHPSYRDTVPKNSAELLVESVRTLEIRDALTPEQLEVFVLNAGMPVNAAPSVFWFPVSGWTGPSILLEKINFPALAFAGSSGSSINSIVPTVALSLSEIIQSIGSRLGVTLNADQEASLELYANTQLQPNGSTSNVSYNNADSLSRRTKGAGFYYILMGMPAYQLK